MLQLITAVIKPQRLGPVKETLKQSGVAGMTISEAHGFGRQGGHTESFRGAEYEVEFVPKTKIEILCEDSEVDLIVEAVAAAAHTGSIGDGKIWVTPVERAVRIRTGEVGDDAV
ncbi:MAG TPA: P-II family nitrogen regulator [Acidimicrobiia bacterium]